ncbi:hypothetical protein [Phormidium sp. CCY1219]|uniref:hypothetical protein n=1 Tax=Phormidium sp. CCY1219 TaxID=2886104 RepID=UPI002D1F592B|nr:hypothetical protein [Phormidium sp. CCY1219]MEB3830619.1 hypothetical protein [Phormidium sp. CCY1219]
MRGRGWGEGGEPPAPVGRSPWRNGDSNRAMQSVEGMQHFFISCRQSAIDEMDNPDLVWQTTKGWPMLRQYS